MSRGRRSRGCFAGQVSSPFALELVGQCRAREPPAERLAMVGGADGDVVVVEPEVDLVAWFDAELVSQLLGNDDLPLGADAVSHTGKYNPRRANRTTGKGVKPMA